MWFILAIVGSLFGAFFMEVNRHFKQDGIKLNMWRTLFQSVMFMTVVFFFPWPDNFVFYLIGIVGGLVIAFADCYVWHLAANHNGRVASMSGPIRALVPFLAWFLIVPSSFWALWARPVEFVLVMAGMAMVLWGGFHIRKNKVGWDTFKPLMLVGTLNGLMLVARKLSVEVSDVFIQMMQIFFLHYFVAFVSLALFVGCREGRAGLTLTRDMTKAAFLIGVSVLLSAQFLNVSVALAPNAGYPPAIFLLIPIWLMLYHKIIGVKDTASPYAAAIVVIGVMLMLVAAA